MGLYMGYKKLTSRKSGSRFLRTNVRAEFQSPKGEDVEEDTK